MPFANKDKNKEYQKEWQRQKAARTSEKDPRNRGSSVRPLQKGVVTWEELQTRVHLDRIKTFDECVTQALARLSGKRTDRMEIAALALRACQIKQGGDRRSKTFKEAPNPRALSEFARAVRIHHKTISEWIRVLIFIRVHIPPEAPIDYRTGCILINDKTLLSRPLENYTRLLDSTSDLRIASNVIRLIRSARGSLAKRGIAGWPKDKLELLDESLESLVETVGRARKKKGDVPWKTSKK